MKRVALAVLAACIAMALTACLYFVLAFRVLPGGTSAFSIITMACGPGFLALAATYILLAPRNRGHVLIALILILARYLTLDHLFLAPKRTELERDIAQMRHAGQPLPRSY